MTSSEFSLPCSDKLIRHIAKGYADKHNSAEDLYQEGLIKIWETEQRKPGQSPYYYISAAEHRMSDIVVRRYSNYGAPSRNGPSTKDTTLRMDDDAGNYFPPSRIGVPEREFDSSQLMRNYPHLMLWAGYGYTFLEVAKVLGESVKVARNRIESEREEFKARVNDN